MLQADSQGTVNGSFTVPSGVPSGTKLVQFTGQGGSMGEATYTGSGTIRLATVRRVSTLIQRRVDPLAQTFTLEQSRHIAAVDLWFTVKGTKPVQVQIRETTTGIPNQEIVAQVSLNSDQVSISGQATRFEFSPVFLNADQEYAIVVLTDDADYEISIAELGKFDLNQGWVTSQPYQVGVLLSSSNASTWTPHQNSDMKFNLQAARFSETEQVVALGQIDADQITDWLPMAVVERPGGDTDLQFRFKVEGSEDGFYTSQEGEPLNLPTNISGKLDVEAVLTGTALRSPILYPGVQAALGQVQQSADYITRAIPCNSDVNTETKLSVLFEAFLPGIASVDVFAEIDGVWQALNAESSSPVDENWQELRMVLTNITSTQVRVKLQLNGNAQDRPRARSLRVLTT